MSVKVVNLIWSLERSVLMFGGAALVVWLMSKSFNPFEDGFSVGVLLAWILSVSIMSGITFAPYYVFYRMSNKVGSQVSSLTFSYIRLVVSISIIAISWWLYYVSGKSVEGSESSTASIIYAVLPVYILLGGCFIYGMLIYITKKEV